MKKLSSRIARATLVAMLGLSLVSGSSSALAKPGGVTQCSSGTALKIEHLSVGSFPPVTVTSVSGDKTSFTWTSEVNVIEVLVKGGPDEAKSNPGGTSGTASTATNPNSGKLYEISHVVFCLGDAGTDDDGGNDEVIIT